MTDKKDTLKFLTILQTFFVEKHQLLGSYPESYISYVNSSLQSYVAAQTQFSLSKFLLNHNFINVPIVFEQTNKKT